MEKIITDTDKLGTYITNTLKAYASTGRRIHVALVSAMWHAAKSGNPALLNRVYEGLRSNDKSAVKLYVRRVHAILGLEGEAPDGLPSEIVIAAVEKGAVFALEKDVFKVIKGHTSNEAVMLVKLCEDRFIEPDGDTDKYVLDRNNFAEVKTLGDAQVLEQLIKLANSLDTTSETKKVTVSAPIKAFLEGIRDKAETFKLQVTLPQG